MPKITEGTRLRLMPVEDNPEEFGTALESPDNGVVTVQLDKKYWGDDTIDGIVEVPVDQVKIVK